MNEALTFLLAPFIMCLILVGIHCYLGIHVIMRGVIFVDLALAQVAALGTTVAFLMGFEHHDMSSYFISLFSTLVAAAFLALANRMEKKLSQEALIGIIYAFSTASIILVIDQISHGTEHLKYALVGQLLWVSWDDVLKVAGIYSVVALIHYICRRQILANSQGASRSWLWDFVFYALFGVVITSSVQVAGVLLVFALLIVPALLGSYFYQEISKRLLFGWSLGFVLCAIGMSLSYWFDKPSGAFIVMVFTIVPLLFVLLKTTILPYRK